MVLILILRFTSFILLWLSFGILELSHCYVVSEFDSSPRREFVQSSQKIREKRYLVYPNGAPSRSQFIIGLGIPTESGEQAVTIGVVIKFEYDLPDNSTQYSDRILQYAPFVSSRGLTKEDNSGEITEQKKLSQESTIKKTFTAEVDDEDEPGMRYNDESASTESEIDDKFAVNDNKIYKEIFHGEVKRYIRDSKNGEIPKNIPKKLSLQEAIKEQEKKDALSRDKEASTSKMNRWDLYKIIEHLAGRYGMGGRECMLRTICEAAETPFTHLNGLFGEIIHILFTPSSTRDPVSMHADHEYHAAERLGREAGGNCDRLFPECESSMLDAFSQVGLDALHQPTSF